MTSTTVRELLGAGAMVANAWVSMDSSYGAEVLSHVGYDAVTIDCQHGMFDVGRAVALLQAVSAGPAVPMARTPALDPATIGKLLDGGAMGIICPGVDTGAQCADFVAACRYPPVGRRSFGPARGLLVGGPGYVERANDLIMTWAMVESATAHDNLDAILAVDGLDGIYVGPNDLAMSMGEPPGNAPAPRVMDALADIATRAQSAGIALGIFCGDLATVSAMADLGYRLISPRNDVQLLRSAAIDGIDVVRRAIPGRE